MSENMIAGKHTPGPWQVFGEEKLEQEYRIRIDSISDGVVRSGPVAFAKSYGPLWPSSLPESEANARLIAAAPDLLEACRTIFGSLKWEESRSGTTYNGYEQLAAAIAKATGGVS